jgi:hypothetical protein
VKLPGSEHPSKNQDLPAIDQIQCPGAWQDFQTPVAIFGRLDDGGGEQIAGERLPRDLVNLQLL